jgi:hypothetical protein
VPKKKGPVFTDPFESKEKCRENSTLHLNIEIHEAEAYQVGLVTAALPKKEGSYPPLLVHLALRDELPTMSLAGAMHEVAV